MSINQQRLSNAIIDRVRDDFVKAVNVSGVTVTYNVMQPIVEFGTSGVSGVSGTGTIRDPLYSQPAFVKSTAGDGKRYTGHSIVALVNLNPRPGSLRALGLDKKTNAMFSVAAKTIEDAGIVPEEQGDRITCNGIDYDIIDIHVDWLVEVSTEEIKNICWAFGCVKRSGRI